MKTHRIEKYRAMLAPMTADEFRQIQAELELPNAGMARILNCSEKSIEGYRSNSPTWGTPVPSGTRGFIRMMVQDYAFREWKTGKNLENYHKKLKHFPRRPVGRPKK